VAAACPRTGREDSRCCAPRWRATCPSCGCSWPGRGVGRIAAAVGRDFFQSNVAETIIFLRCGAWERGMDAAPSSPSFPWGQRRRRTRTWRGPTDGLRSSPPSRPTLSGKTVPGRAPTIHWWSGGWAFHSGRFESSPRPLWHPLPHLRALVPCWRPDAAEALLGPGHCTLPPCPPCPPPGGIGSLLRTGLAAPRGGALLLRRQ